MFRLFLLSVCLMIACNANAQKKLVFRDGLKRAVIRPGKEIGVTKTGDVYYFHNWKNICSGCYYQGCMDSTYSQKLYLDSLYFYDRDCGDSSCYANRWVLDSVKADHLVLRRLSSDSAKYRFDTVAVDYLGQYEKSMKLHPDLFCIGALPYPDSIIDGGYLIYAVALDYDRMKIPMDSIASFTFPESSSCSTFGMGVPIMALAGIIGGPIAAANDGDSFSWPVFVGFESLGIYLVGSVILSISNLKVREYRVGEWKVKVK